jgi:hypothetical protein
VFILEQASFVVFVFCVRVKIRRIVVFYSNKTCRLRISERRPIARFLFF